LYRIDGWARTSRSTPHVNFAVEKSVYFPMPASASQKSAEIRFRCPCCGYRTLEAPAAMKLCPVCWWEDDGQEDSDAHEIRLTVNGHLSLTEARASYARCGAADLRFLPYVRKPHVTEE
jgi:Cysteine-rich CPCC